MATYVFNTSNPGPVTHNDGEDAFTLADTWDNIVVVDRGAEIAAYGAGSGGIVALFENTFLIAGHVHSEHSSALQTQGSVVVTETGTITGGVDGAYLHGANIPGQPNHVSNAGVISGSLNGLRLEANENVVVNSGKIIGGTAVYAPFSNRTFMLTNTGVIEGTKEMAIYGAIKGSSIIHNQGSIIGDVILGSGDDLYDGRGGTVTGEVDFDTGLDRGYGGSGSEIFVTWGGSKFLDGGDGLDTVRYGKAATVDLRITAQQQTGLESQDTLRNIENLTGSAFNDSFFGSHADNVLAGEGGNDKLSGLNGRDKLSGGAGNDRLDGGLNPDELSGGDGKDTFIFSAKLKNNVDQITDFRSADDTIHLSKAIFTKLSKGGLKTGAFFSGSTAKDANDRVGYNKTTGDLIYDADGSGTKYTAVKFAHLEELTVLRANDFLVV